jgi:hypothetical protein
MKNYSFKQIIGYSLAILTLLSTMLALLSLWEIIEINIDWRKIFNSFIILFTASSIVLFIFSVVLKNKGN